MSDIAAAQASQVDVLTPEALALHQKPFEKRVVWTRSRIQQVSDAFALEPTALPCSSEGTDASNGQADIRVFPNKLEWIYHNCQKRCLSHVINDRFNLPKLKANKA